MSGYGSFDFGVLLDLSGLPAKAWDFRGMDMGER